MGLSVSGARARTGLRREQGKAQQQETTDGKQTCTRR